MDQHNHHRLIARSQHWLHLERLELRALLSVSSGGNQNAFAPGELLIGFEGEVPAMLASQGAESALNLAEHIVGSAGLHSGRILYDLPASENRAARLATHWQLAETINVQDVAMKLSDLPGIAYAEPNAILTSQAIPSDASFVGDWEFGVQEHLTRIGAPDAWDVTTGDPRVVVAVIDSGVDLDHPDLDDNLLAGTTFVEGTTSAQDDYGHGTLVAGLIAAEMNNLTALANEAGGDLTWAGGVVGVAPNVSILPVKVLNQNGDGRVSDIAAGINYAADPDGDPATDDGADIINVSLGGDDVSQVVSDAIANAYSQGALVVASVGYWDGGYPAQDAYTLAVTALDADDVWDGDHQTGSFVDISAQGVDVLTTFVDREDPSETIQFAGAYGRESGSSLSTPIVAGAAALVKSLHPNWGPNEVAGQLLATADSISSVNALNLQGQLGAGRVSAAAAVESTARPRVISLVGLGDVDADVAELSHLGSGDRVEVRFSHAMQTTSVLDSSRYQLKYLGDPTTTSDDQTVELSVVTEPLPPDATGVTDTDNYYVPFPGRGVQLRVGAFPGDGSFPAGLYRLRVRGVSSLGSGLASSLTHEFRVASRANFSNPHVIVQPELDSPGTVFAVDLDSDEDLDLLATSGTNKVVWYKNTDGAGTFGPQRVISTIAAETTRSSPTAPADLDGDGDVDVLHVIHNSEEDRIVWYENVDGAGSFGPPQVVTTLYQSPFRGIVPRVHAADLDDDGDVDLLTTYRGPQLDDRTAWYENTDGAGTFGPERLIISNRLDRKGVRTADLDGDGDLDVLRQGNGEIDWFENTDGQGNFRRHLIADPRASRSAIAADVDRDGDLDVLASINDEGIVWYENTNGSGSFGPGRLVIATDEPGRIRAADMDHDGDLDVLHWNYDSIAWYENLGGDGTFGVKRVITEPRVVSMLVDAADIDSDRDLDVVFVSWSEDKIAWHENIDGAGTFGPQRRVGSGVASPGITTISDVDGDGDPDVVYYSHPESGGTIAWQENIDGLGTFGPQRVVTRDATKSVEVMSLGTADLDGDNDPDVISSFFVNSPPRVGTITWYGNTDGLGTYGPQGVIAEEEGVRPIGISTGDLDGDGDLDVLSAWNVHNHVIQQQPRIVWYENLDGAGNYGTERLIEQHADTFTRYRHISAADFDGDGDWDVLAAVQDRVVWYENTDGLGTYGPQRLIAQLANEYDLRGAIRTPDLDGDGDLDVLLNLRNSGIVAWFENEDGAGNFGTQRVIIQGDGGASTVAADLDNDRDLDVIWASNYIEDEFGTITFSENIDGAGTFGPQLVIAVDPGNYFESVFAADVDTDGDLDVVTVSLREMVWYENLLAHAGDANRDGRFDSTDLVQVFQAGEYEDEVDGNSTWEEGDWNGDGDFDSGDLVEAFQKGLYERKSRVVAANAIAAAVDWLFAEEESIRRGRAYVA